MDRLWRSNSSISSRTSCPPEIVNEEDHTIEENDLIPDFSKCNIPKVDTKTVYKTSFVESTFYSTYRARIVEQMNKYSLFLKFMKNAACLQKEILMNSLLPKNLVICILVWFKLQLNHSPERVLMLLFLCV